MGSVVSKIIYLLRVPKITVAYSATAVKTVFSNFLKFFVKQEKCQINISLFCQNIDFKIPSMPGNDAKNLLTTKSYMYKFRTPLP